MCELKYKVIPTCENSIVLVIGMPRVCDGRPRLARCNIPATSMWEFIFHYVMWESCIPLCDYVKSILLIGAYVKSVLLIGAYVIP